MDDPEGFAEFARARQTRLLRLAYLLCGDRRLAQDLVQTTFVKLAGHWRTVAGLGSPDAYARCALVNAYIDHRRTRLPGLLAFGVPDRPAPGHDPDARLALLAALAELPPRGRAVLVLRFWEDLSVEQTAQVLSISAGTVKSQTAKALARLRAVASISELVASVAPPGTPATTPTPTKGLASDE